MKLDLSYCQYIETQIAQGLIKDFHSLDYGLRKGKVGAFLYLSLFSECYGLEDVRELSQSMLFDLVRNHHQIGLGLLDGCYGFVFAIRKLQALGIVDKDYELESIIGIIENNYYGKYASVPFKFDLDDDMFSDGIIHLMRLNDKSTYGYYKAVETNLLLLKSARRILDATYHDNAIMQRGISWRLLHSLLYYIKSTDEAAIFPVMTDHLLKLAQRTFFDKIRNLKGTPLIDIDRYICGRYLGVNENIVSTKEELLSDLNLCGLFSYIYADKALCESYIDNYVTIDASNMDILKDSVSSTTEGITGIGLGILQTHFPNTD